MCVLSIKVPIWKKSGNLLYVPRTYQSIYIPTNRFTSDRHQVTVWHHHHVAPSAWISLTLSCHPSLSSIASGKSSGQHPVSAESCCMKILAGRTAFARPCEGVHRSTSLMSSSLLLQQCPAYLVHLTLIVFVMGGRWPYSCCFVGCNLHYLFNIACNILVLLPSSFFSKCLVSIYVVHPYSSNNMTTAWKNDNYLFTYIPTKSKWNAFSDSFLLWPGVVAPVRVPSMR